jgi:DNA-binding IclR family transcriptional regulator
MQTPRARGKSDGRPLGPKGRPVGQPNGRRAVALAPVGEGTASQRRDGVQVIARAADVLRRLAAEPDGLTLIQLSLRVGLPRSTTHRIVRALSQEGFVRTTPSGKLRIGPALVGIAVSSRRDLRHEAAPYIERLSHELHETVDLAVLDGDEVLFIDQYTSRRTLRVVAEIGARFPLHCTANGKAILAALPAKEAERLLPRKLAAVTEHSITDRDVHTVGVCAAAAALRDSVGTLAAISVIIPAVRSHGSWDKVTAALLRTRDELQAVLLVD